MDRRLKPCPACGGDARVFIWSMVTRYVECMHTGCRVSGPEAATEDVAIEKWNAMPRADTTRYTDDTQTMSWD